MQHGFPLAVVERREQTAELLIARARFRRLRRGDLRRRPFRLKLHLRAPLVEELHVETCNDALVITQGKVTAVCEGAQCCSLHIAPLRQLQKSVQLLLRHGE